MVGTGRRFLMARLALAYDLGKHQATAKYMRKKNIWALPVLDVVDGLFVTDQRSSDFGLGVRHHEQM